MNKIILFYLMSICQVSSNKNELRQTKDDQLSSESFSDESVDEVPMRSECIGLDKNKWLKKMKKFN